MVFYYARAKGRCVTTISRAELEELSTKESYNFACRKLNCSYDMLRKFVMTYHIDLHEKFTINGIRFQKQKRRWSKDASRTI